MTLKRNRRASQKKRRHKAVYEYSIHLGDQYELRTLRRSARKQLEQKCAHELWILAWHRDQGQRYVRCAHERATLLGLPAELRQQILVLGYSLQDLMSDVTILRLDHELGRETREHLAWAGDVLWSKHVNKKKLRQLPAHRSESDLIRLLDKRIEKLSSTTPVIAHDMQHVGRLWQQQLETSLDQHPHGHRSVLPDLVIAQALYRRSAIRISAPVTKKRRETRVVDRDQPNKRIRPSKCWYCTRRHFNGNSVCPMAEEDPQKWKQLTRRVGGWRGAAAPAPTFQGHKMTFDD